MNPDPAATLSGEALSAVITGLPPEAISKFFSGLSGLTAEETNEFCRYLKGISEERKFRVIGAMASSSLTGKRAFMTSLREKHKQRQQAITAGEAPQTNQNVSASEDAAGGSNWNRHSPPVTEEDVTNLGRELLRSHIDQTKSELRLQALEQSASDDASGTNQPEEGEPNKRAIAANGFMSKRDRPRSNIELMKADQRVPTKVRTGQVAAEGTDGSLRTKSGDGKDGRSGTGASSASGFLATLANSMGLGSLGSSSSSVSSTATSRTGSVSKSASATTGPARPGSRPRKGVVSSTQSGTATTSAMHKSGDKSLSASGGSRKAGGSSSGSYGSPGSHGKNRSSSTYSSDSHSHRHSTSSSGAPSPGGSGDARSTKWTKEQDDALRSAVEYYGARNWKAIAERVPDRNHAQCLQRWRKVLTPGLVKGTWSEQEDQVLIRLVRAGGKNWGEIAEQIPGRTSKQCRERWRNHLNPAINRAPFTAEEDRIILSEQKRMGNRWSAISKMLQGRTEDAVKIRFKSLTSKNARLNAERKAKSAAAAAANADRRSRPGAVGVGTHASGTAAGGLGSVSSISQSSGGVHAVRHMGQRTDQARRRAAELSMAGVGVVDPLASFSGYRDGQTQPGLARPSPAVGAAPASQRARVPGSSLPIGLEGGLGMGALNGVSPVSRFNLSPDNLFVDGSLYSNQANLLGLNPELLDPDLKFSPGNLALSDPSPITSSSLEGWNNTMPDMSMYSNMNANVPSPGNMYPMPLPFNSSSPGNVSNFSDLGMVDLEDLVLSVQELTDSRHSGDSFRVNKHD